MDENSYLNQVLINYQPRDLSLYRSSIIRLEEVVAEWANNCYREIFPSGSRAKGTAISIASDFDIFASLSSGCNVNNGGMQEIYESLFSKLSGVYSNIRKQNVSIRITLSGLEIDVTPGRLHSGNTNDHTIWLSKQGTWKKTNVKRHITDVSGSGRLKEIKLLKIWRERYNLEFPSIYIEYLLIKDILLGRSTYSYRLANNFYHILEQLSLDNQNPLYKLLFDPANTSNFLSSLMTDAEKRLVVEKAKYSIRQTNWSLIVS